MSPIWAQGVASFQVEWTDGQTQTTETPTLTRLKWYPYTDGTSGTNDHVPTGARDPSSYDDHMYLFGQGGDAFPVALKFTYRLTDPNNRLNGGRTFVCVVDIP